MIEAFQSWQQQNPVLGQIVLIAIILLLAFFTHWMTRRIMLVIIYRFAKKTKTQWDDALVRHRFFSRLANIAPALIIFLASKWNIDYSEILIRITEVYIVIIFVRAISAFLSAVNTIYQTYDVSIERPIKGYIQIAKIFMYIVGGIFIIAVLLNKSPWVLLSGLGAVMAVIMLIFKDTILSLVASIKLISNNMIKIGDWISMPEFGADGDVIDIALHTVTVQNFDKTIVSLPTSKLIDEPFKNWRGMKEARGRRIKRAIHIDMNSIKFADNKLLQKLKKVTLLKPYILEREKEINDFNKKNNIDTSVLINGRRMTNAGLLRAYIEAYLKQHPKVKREYTFLIRQLDPGPEGLPLEVYIFINDTIWPNYERIQSDIFDHIIASLTFFDLKLFQSPTGNDFNKFL